MLFSACRTITIVVAADTGATRVAGAPAQPSVHASECREHESPGPAGASHHRVGVLNVTQAIV